MDPTQPLAYDPYASSARQEQGGTGGRMRGGARYVWAALWLFYLASAVQELATGHMSAAARVLGSIGLGVVVAGYILLTAAWERLPSERERIAVLAVMWLCAVALVVGFHSGDWIGIYVYVGVAAAAALPWRLSRVALLVVVASVAVTGLAVGAPLGEVAALTLTTGLTTSVMVGIRFMIELVDELQSTRQIVARLAANEERLRLARDLHDLLGHSLSLITLKSELAGRLLAGGREDDAANQVAEIEQVSRQALVDVREAVSGYRRPTLGAELAGARTTLSAAGIELVETPESPDAWAARLEKDTEGALAWAVREAVTNVVRHSRARTCAITLDDAGGDVRLTVRDNGRGGVGGGDGNGLTGLRERLVLASGTLDAGPLPGGKGFAVTASVPAKKLVGADPAA